MADEPLRIKVDKNVYQQTLDSLETQLEALQSHKENLQRQLDRLNSGNTFAGSDVRSAIEKTEEVLKTVGDSISRVMGYKMTIQQQLDASRAQEHSCPERWQVSISLICLIKQAED